MPWYWEERTPIGWVVVKSHSRPQEKRAEGGKRGLRNVTYLEDDIPLSEARAQLQSEA